MDPNPSCDRRKVGGRPACTLNWHSIMHRLLKASLLVLGLVVETSSPLKAQSVAAREIEVTHIVSAAITSEDPQLDDGTRFHLWRLLAQPGDSVEITMESSDFDAFLMITRGSEGLRSPQALDDDSGGGTNARIVYAVGDAESFIVANTVEPDGSGAYRLRVIPFEGGSGSAPIPLPDTIVAAVLGDSSGIAADQTLFQDYTLAGRAGEELVVALESSQFSPFVSIGQLGDMGMRTFASGGGDSLAMLRYVFPETGQYVIRANTNNPGERGTYTLRVDTSRASATPQTGPLHQLRRNSRETNVLTQADPQEYDFTYHKDYRYAARSGERVVIDLRSTVLDTYLAVGRQTSAGFEVLAENDDVADDSTDSTIIYRFPSAGDFVIRVSSYSLATGAYDLAVQTIR